MGKEINKIDYLDVETDILIIGGGAAGSYAALELSEKEDLKILIVDKANIDRSGCLAAGINALNAYIGPDETIDGYVDYVSSEFNGLVREDLLKGIAENLNESVKKIEELGLPILKDSSGKYIMRGKRSVKINGENIKPILSKAVKTKDNVKVLSGVNIFDYIIKDNEILGAVGYDLAKNKIFFINSKITIIASGGASGIYKPNMGDSSQHKMWYSPFNTGAGYAMGIRAGAEMTSFEMRFIALRLAGTIAPTGTIAQGVKTPHINDKGQEYIDKYGRDTTINRLLATISEERNSRGPCYLDTRQINQKEEDDLIKSYLNMAPVQALAWLDKDERPSDHPVRISGTEPYIVGGHGGAGYWVDKNRRTSIRNLYAIGDVAGGSPKKYVTGCFAEAMIASRDILKKTESQKIHGIAFEEKEKILGKIVDKLDFQNRKRDSDPILDKNDEKSYDNLLKIEGLEKKMQEIMDKYAGGISTYYEYTEHKLIKAKKMIDNVYLELIDLKASSPRELVFIQELEDRIWVAKALIVHLEARKETRWRCYQENIDYPFIDENYFKYINSRYEAGDFKLIYREIVKRDDIYEYSN